jgi:hypothetical protein
MTYFFLVTVPLLMGAALIGAWLRISPFLIAIIVLLLGTTWLFG